jgi:ribonuclease Z
MGRTKISTCASTIRWHKSCLFDASGFFAATGQRPLRDPALYLACTNGNRALLFDIGDISALDRKEVLAISHVFVSHTHMDHFIGFDHLLRCSLGHGKPLHLFGPAGFMKNVSSRLAGYSWNLLDCQSAALVVTVTEISSDGVTTTRHAARHRFAGRRVVTDAPITGGQLLEEPRFRVSCTILDHRIPCLGFRLDERFHIRIDRRRLERLGLAPGPWISQFKKALYRKPERAGSMRVASRTQPSGWQEHSLPWLVEHICDIRPGRSIAYITDVAGSAENASRIIDLVQGVDHLFIEAMFCHDLRQNSGP